MTFCIAAGLDRVRDQASIILEIHRQEGSGCNHMSIFSIRNAQRDFGGIREIEHRGKSTCILFITGTGLGLIGL